MEDGWAVHLPNWAHVSEVIKAAAYGASIPDRNRYAFTLHMTPEVIERALRSKGFAKYMQGRVQRALRKAFPDRKPGFVLVLEATYDLQGVTELITFHLHGAIEVPDVIMDGEVIDVMSHLGDIEEALREAGGSTSPEKRARQVHVTRAYNVIGWFAYLAKSRLTTHHALKSARKMERIKTPKSEGIVAATNPLKAAGQRWFDDARTKETYFAVTSNKRRKK
jgi:hypothetical protein